MPNRIEFVKGVATLPSGRRIRTPFNAFALDDTSARNTPGDVWVLGGPGEDDTEPRLVERLAEPKLTEEDCAALACLMIDRWARFAAARVASPSARIRFERIREAVEDTAPEDALPHHHEGARGHHER